MYRSVRALIVRNALRSEWKCFDNRGMYTREREISISQKYYQCARIPLYFLKRTPSLQIFLCLWGAQMTQTKTTLFLWPKRKYKYNSLNKTVNSNVNFSYNIDIRYHCETIVFKPTVLLLTKTKWNHHQELPPRWWKHKIKMQKSLVLTLRSVGPLSETLFITKTSGAAIPLIFETQKERMI